MSERELELLKNMNQLIKALQEIRFVCERAKTFYIEESDIDEILEISSKYV